SLTPVPPLTIPPVLGTRDFRSPRRGMRTKLPPPFPIQGADSKSPKFGAAEPANSRQARSGLRGRNPETFFRTSPVHLAQTGRGPARVPREKVFRVIPARATFLRIAAPSDGRRQHARRLKC